MRGLPLWAAGRAADVLWLQFGGRRTAPTAGDPARVVGEYALHVHCPWRLSAAGGVIAGRSDMYVAADPELPEADFRWDRPGDALLDAQLRRWVDGHAAAPVRVEVIAVDRCAGFVARLAPACALEVFPDAFAVPHDLREQWRLLRPGVEAAHFVVNNHGWGWE